MDVQAAEQLTRYRDSTPAAISRRLRAARMAINMPQNTFAQEAKIKPTTYNSQEVKGSPSMEILHFLYVNHRIGPNFILFGEFLPLPGDVQLALIEALRAIDSCAAK